ncbi:MAG: hypothetical protein CMK32_08535 [Porticoccaceae bacterium]|nr:hypothetical protein [Porticoccaceae bacterium]
MSQNASESRAEVKQGILLYEADPSGYQAAVNEQKAEVKRPCQQLQFGESEANQSSDLTVAAPRTRLRSPKFLDRRQSAGIRSRIPRISGDRNR